jgi:hypothetical protein
MSVRKSPVAYLVLCIAVLGLLSAAPRSSVASTSSAKTGHIVGSIRDSGPGEYVKRPGTVILRNSSHRVIAREHVETGHRFDFAVYPGTYYLSHWKAPHCFYGSGDSREIRYVPVQARAHSTTHVTIYCAVR